MTPGGPWALSCGPWLNEGEGPGRAKQGPGRT